MKLTCGYLRRRWCSSSPTTLIDQTIFDNVGVVPVGEEEHQQGRQPDHRARPVETEHFKVACGLFQCLNVTVTLGVALAYPCKSVQSPPEWAGRRG